MTDESAASLEREANAVREQVADTAEKLRDKMSPGQMLDEFADYFRNSDGSLALDNLKTQVRDNPLPLALVGAGLAWLFLGGGPTTKDLKETASGFVANDDDASQPESDQDELFPRGSSSMSNAGATVADAAASAYSAVGDAATGTRDAVSAAASDAKDYAADAGRKISKGSRRVGRQVQNGFLDVLSKEPLVLGALGIAVGTAIGAMLPSTEFEDENIGPYRDKLRDEAEKKVHEGIDEAKAVASSTYQTVKDEADRQGLAPDDEKSIAERIGNVGKAAATTAEGSIRDKSEPKKPRS